MGESAAAEAATSERDVLLATKLNVPGLRPDLVPRPRLAQRLEEGRGQGLVLVCAPAGYGKTVLLAEWARRGRRPVAWLSLDAGDNDPARFWRHAVAALDRVRPGISERVSLPGLLLLAGRRSRNVRPAGRGTRAVRAVADAVQRRGAACRGIRPSTWAARRQLPAGPLPPGIGQHGSTALPAAGRQGRRESATRRPAARSRVADELDVHFSPVVEISAA